MSKLVKTLFLAWVVLLHIAGEGNDNWKNKERIYKGYGKDMERLWKGYGKVMERIWKGFGKKG